MLKNILLWAALKTFVSVAITSCSPSPMMMVTHYGATFDVKKIATIKAGVTTVNQTIKTLGEPYQRAIINGRRALVYRMRVIARKSEKIDPVEGSSDHPVNPTEVLMPKNSIVSDDEYVLFYKGTIIVEVRNVR